MTDFKTTKQQMYSTPFDVRMLLYVARREIEEEDGSLKEVQDVTDPTVEHHIINGDAIIRAYLVGPYGLTALANETPYFIGPVSVDSNRSTAVLRGVIVAATAITEQWVIKFIAQDAFSLTGSVSGAQGTGAVNADFTSTNSDIQIKTADWSLAEDAHAEVGEQHLFGTYISHPVIRAISIMLATASLADYLYSESESKQSSWGKTYHKKAMDLLKDLIDPKKEVSLGGTSETGPSFEVWSYHIDGLGRDASKYATIGGDVLPYDY